jgi:hypothetical protein
MFPRKLFCIGFTVTGYSNSHSSGGSRPVSSSTRGLHRFAGYKGTAEPSLEYRDPFRRAKRWSVGAGSIRAVVAGRRYCEKCSKIADQRAQWCQRCQLVIVAREMGTGARRWPVLGTARQPRDHRIERDSTRSRQQVRRRCASAKVARSPSPSAVGTIRWT